MIPIRHALICLLVLTTYGCCSTEEKMTPEKLAFLGGAILGDNLQSVLIGRVIGPLSQEKRMLFYKVNRALGLPEDSNNILMKAIWKEGIPIQESISNAVQALSKYEASVKSIHGKRVGDAAKLGAVTISIFRMAQSLEFTPLGTNPDRDSVAKSFTTYVQSLKNMPNNMDLPDNVASRLRSLPYYENIDTFEAKSIKNALTEILTLYDIKPITDVTLNDNKVSIKDADISSIVDRIEKCHESLLEKIGSWVKQLGKALNLYS